MKELEQEIIDIIADEGNIDRRDITLDSNLYDLGIDSLSSLEILVALETKYDITIPQSRLKDVNNIKEIIMAVVSEIQKKNGRSGNRRTHVTLDAKHSGVAKAINRIPFDGESRSWLFVLVAQASLPVINLTFAS